MKAQNLFLMVPETSWTVLDPRMEPRRDAWQGARLAGVGAESPGN